MKMAYNFSKLDWYRTGGVLTYKENLQERILKLQIISAHLHSIIAMA